MAEDESDIQEGGTTLVEAERYLKTGSHIGTKFKSGDMARYIYKVRRDGLKVLNIQTIDSRIKFAAGFLAQYSPEKIVAVSRKLYGQTAVKKFAEAIGAKAVVGRFVPGTLTNPAGKKFFEAKVLLVADPEADEQAIKEAERVRIPVVALCSTNNATRLIDLVIPVNNKGRKSLALTFWLLAREILKSRKTIASDEAFAFKEEDFEYTMTEGDEEKQRNQFRGKGREKEGFRGGRRGGRGFDRDKDFGDSRSFRQRRPFRSFQDSDSEAKPSRNAETAGKSPDNSEKTGKAEKTGSEDNRTPKSEES